MTEGVLKFSIFEGCRFHPRSGISEGNVGRQARTLSQAAHVVRHSFSALRMQPIIRNCECDLTAWSSNLQNELRRSILYAAAVKCQPWDLGNLQKRLTTNSNSATTAENRTSEHADGRGGCSETRISSIENGISSRRIKTTTDEVWQMRHSALHFESTKTEPRLSLENSTTAPSLFARLDSVPLALPDCDLQGIVPRLSKDGLSSGQFADDAVQCVVQNLYFGNMAAALNARCLCREGIDALVVVSTTDRSPCLSTPTVHCSCCKPHSRARLLASISWKEAAAGACYDEINNFILVNQRVDRKVLVCSNLEDEQLAAAVVIQYAIKFANVPMTDVLSSIGRPRIIERSDLICLLQNAESSMLCSKQHSDTTRAH